MAEEGEDVCRLQYSHLVSTRDSAQVNFASSANILTAFRNLAALTIPRAISPKSKFSIQKT
jgi:hypothetical protein